MPQSDGTNSIHRIALRFPKEDGKKSMYRFKVNPENYTLEAPQRTNAIKAKSDIIIEDYGKDTEVINFSGTTGFRPVKEEGGLKTGKQKMEDLQQSVENYANQGGDGSVPGAYLEFFNFTDDKYYKVHLAPQGLKISRSKEEPLLFRYDITLVVLGDLSEADRGAVTTEEFGNVKPNAEQRVDEGVKALDNNARKTRDKNTQEISRQTTNKNGLDGRNSSEMLRDSNKNLTGKDAMNRLIGKGNRDNSGVYNPRQNTNGLKGVIDDMALKIGYGDGGVKS